MNTTHQRSMAVEPAGQANLRQLPPVPAPDRAMPYGYRDEQVGGVWKVVCTVETEPS